MTTLVLKDVCKLKKACIHVYTGENWKYLKTVLGMALRACGAGFSVGFFNFGSDVSDIVEFANRLQGMHVLKNIEQDTSQFDMLILYDCENNQADLRSFLASKPQNTEIVLCGAVFSDDILAAADLVSEITAFS